MITAHFSAIGNASLLQRLDFHQVQCSRRFFAYRRDRYGNPLPDEPPALETPEFALFDHCAEGSLLMLAPAAWPFMLGRKDMTRDDACALNRIAQAIAGEGAAEINYHGMAPADIDRLVREAVAGR